MKTPISTVMALFPEDSCLYTVQLQQQFLKIICSYLCICKCECTVFSFCLISQSLEPCVVFYGA